MGFSCFQEVFKEFSGISKRFSEFLRISGILKYYKEFQEFSEVFQSEYIE
jgi:hypothetical protein